jgi:hypothetical protein
MLTIKRTMICSDNVIILTRYRTRKIVAVEFEFRMSKKLKSGNEQKDSLVRVALNDNENSSGRAWHAKRLASF